MEIKQKKSIGRLLVGDWKTATIVTVGIGAALYGVLMNYGGIQVFTNTQLTTAMIIPVVVGGLFGPLPALVTCGVGNIIADLIGGWGMWFDWSIGNALMAFCVGLLPLYGADIKGGVFTVKHAIIYSVCCILGNVLAFGVVTPVFSYLLYASDLNITFLQAFVATLGNCLVLLVIGIPILILLARRYKSRSNLSQEKS
ncbi:MAG TPA: ECF-type riboflavin transporter substrate-binding protein, partial [Clostridia bacterium]|nr:ECF-type riboflavin transporter substrate-binding protein [Clostridia bacterium]